MLCHLFCVHKMDYFVRGYYFLSFLFVDKLIKVTFLTVREFEGIHSLDLAPAYRASHCPAAATCLFASMDLVHLVGSICWTDTQLMAFLSIELSTASHEFPAILLSHIHHDNDC